MELIDIEKLKTFLASKVTMMTDYDDGIAASRIDEYIDEFITGQQTAVQCEDAVSRESVLDAIDEWKEACLDSGHKETVSDIKLIRKDFIELPAVTRNSAQTHSKPKSSA